MKKTENRTTKKIQVYLNHLYYKGKKDSTIAAYRADLKSFESYLRDSYPSVDDFAKIQVKHLSDFRKLLVEKEFKKSTIKRKIDVLHAFFEYLVENETVKTNPCEKLLMNKLESRAELEFNYLTMNQVRLIVANATHNRDTCYRDLAMLKLVVYAGFKKNEVMDLKNGDIDAPNQMVQIRGRMIPVNKEVSLALQSIHEGKVAEAEDYVFKSNGEKMSQRTFTNVIERTNKTPGLDIDFKINSEVLRNSFCIHLAKNGVGIIEISELSGITDGNRLAEIEKYIVRDTKDIG
jgi:site-specific recombinase XerD